MVTALALNRNSHLGIFIEFRKFPKLDQALQVQAPEMNYLHETKPCVSHKVEQGVCFGIAPEIDWTSLFSKLFLAKFY